MLAHSDPVAQEMARLVHERVIKISHVQDDHTDRLVHLESNTTELKQQVAGLQQKATEHDQRFDTVDSQLAGLHDKVGEHDRRFDALEARMGGVEGRLEGVESRLEGVEGTLTEILRRLPEPPAQGQAPG